MLQNIILIGIGYYFGRNMTRDDRFLSQLIDANKRVLAELQQEGLV